MDEIYRFAFRRSRDHELAADVTQDVFVAAIRSIDDPADVTIAWLMTVARNRLIDILRRSSRYREKLRVIEGGLAVDDDLPYERVDLQLAMARLSVEHRLVLTMHYLDGHTVPALAEELGRSAKSVEGLVTRARRNLQRELGSTHG